MVISTYKSYVLRVKHVSILLPNSKRFPLNLGKQPSNSTVSSQGCGDFCILCFGSLPKKMYSYSIIDYGSRSSVSQDIFFVVIDL